MYTYRDIYVIYTDNEEPSLDDKCVIILRYGGKCARTSSINCTLSRHFPSSINSIEENQVLFYQGHPILEPAIHHHGVFTTTTSVESTNFIQALKSPDWVKWIKGEYKKNDKSSEFDLLVDIFTFDRLPSSTCVLRLVLVPTTKKLTDNNYCYCSCHWTNGGTQVKDMDFDQYYSLVLAAYALYLVVSVDTYYHLTIGITYFPKILQNTLEASSKWDIINFHN